jgi:septum formation topological specificity factor MinE
MKQTKEKKEFRNKNAYDLSIKDALEGIEGAVTEMFLGFKIKKADSINVGLIKIEEKQADYVCKIVDENDKKYILHIEFQTTNHFYMRFRMLRYLTELYKKYRLPIIQLVIYLGKDKMTMKDEIKFQAYKTKIDYKYQLVDISTLKCENFIDSKDAGLIALAILCDFQTHTKQEVVQKIRERLETICGRDYNELRNQFYRVEILSNLREDMFEVVKKEEEMLVDRIRVENMPSYHIGMERERERGLKQFQQERRQNLKIRKDELIEGIWLFIESKFNIPKKNIYPLLEKIQSIIKLKEIRKAIFKINNIKDIEALIKNAKED